MELIPVFLASFAAGICASMGLGGGTVLILYLTAAEGLSQQIAQGINLIFFIPCAIITLIYYHSKGMLDLKRIYPAIIVGAISAAAGAYVTSMVDQRVMRKAFGAFMLIMGMMSLRRCQSRLPEPAEKLFSCGGNRDSLQE